MSPNRQIRFAAASVKKAVDTTPEELRDTVVKLTMDNLQLRARIAELLEEKQELLTKIDENEREVSKLNREQQSTEENENGE